uniref:Uncharacterized protein n=1 Tax=Sinocyclocheilus rhinocerous TaxID=307959 RepID=A0A673FLL8_9TELE
MLTYQRSLCFRRIKVERNDIPKQELRLIADVKMSVELDVFVGNTTIMDKEVYQLWLNGYTVNDAVKVRIEGGVMEECEASAEVLLSDTMDQYRTFQMCERLLHHPAKLANQLL